MTSVSKTDIMPFPLQARWDTGPAPESIVTQHYLEGVESHTASLLEGRRHLGIEIALLLADETEVYGYEHMLRTVVEETARLRSLERSANEIPQSLAGYSVAGHGQPLYDSAYMMDVVTRLEGGRARVWGDGFVFVRVPGAVKSLPTKAKEVIEAGTSVMDHQEKWRRALLAADPETGYSSERESSCTDYCYRPSGGFSFEGLVEGIALADFAGHYGAGGKESLVKEIFNEQRKKALAELNGAYSGRILLVAVKQEVVQNEEEAFMWRSHPHGSFCRRRFKGYTATKSNLIGLKLFLDQTTGKPTGQILPCACSRNRQVRYLTAALVDSTRRAADTIMVSVDTMSYKQRKAYEAGVEAAAAKIKELSAATATAATTATVAAATTTVAAPTPANDLITALSAPLS
jgi:hypothetical protein